MVKLSHVILPLALGLMIFLFFTTAYAADDIVRFTHNDQDALIIGEVISKDLDSITIESIYHVVSSSGMAPDRKLLRPQSATVVNIDYYYDKFDVGDYIIASLNKDEEHFKVANSMYKLDSPDYKTLNVYVEHNYDFGLFKKFLNNGIEYNEQNLDAIAEIAARDDFANVIAIIYPATEETSSQANDTPVALRIGFVILPIFLVFGITIFLIRRIVRNRRL